MIKLRWDSDAIPETVIEYSAVFECQSSLLRADLLRDAIGMLSEKYEKIVAEGL